MIKSTRPYPIDWLSLRAIVVDDQPDTLQGIANLLSMLGPSVTQVVSGSEAINLIQTCHYRFHFAIVDMVMPVLSGTETARELRIADKTLPIVFCSGLPRQKFTTELFAFTDSAFLQKPFTRAQLEATLTRLLSTGT